MRPPCSGPEPATVSEWIRWGRTRLESRLENPEQESRYLMEAVLGSRTAVWTDSREILEAGRARTFREWVERRGLREPFHQIVGEVPFCGRSLIIRPGVLIPRPETELLVECCIRALSERKSPGAAPVRILDLGAGSGAIIISLLLGIRVSAGVAVEREENALSVLGDNRRRYGLESRLSLLQGDWGKMLLTRPVFDCVVSNPPYIPTPVLRSLEPEVRTFEPATALDGGPDGLRAYREILAFAPFLLKKEGILAFEVGAGQAGAEPFEQLTRDWNGCFPEGPRVEKDLSGIDRVILWKRKG